MGGKMKVKVEISVNNGTVSGGELIRYRLIQRKYSNYGSGAPGKVTTIGIYNTEQEAKQEKKRLLKRKHAPYSLMFRIEAFVA